MAPQIDYGLTFKQNKNSKTMLAIRARYFEFRPAHIRQDILPSSGLENKLYFQQRIVS